MPRSLSIEYQEQRAISDKCFHPTGAFIEFKEEKVERSISDCFEEQVAKYPGRIAVSSRGNKLTYDELNRLANRIARAILHQREEGEEPIALLLEHGAVVIATILGILKAGKTYVPLEPTCPHTRNVYILENSQASLIVTNDRNLSLASELSQKGCRLLNIDRLDSSLSAENTGLHISPDTIAWILYTSGSTGQPKGVFNNHRNTLYDTRTRVNTLHICAEDRVSLLTSCAFSGSLRKFFPALLTGGSVYMLDAKEEGISDLVGWLIHEGITIHGGRAVFREFLNTLTRREEFPNLRLFTFGGDALYKKDLDLLREYVRPDIIMVTGLGITEVGTVTQYLIGKDTQIIGDTAPVGYELDDRRILLLDEDGQEAGFNEAGEIAIRSRYLSLGYWRRPDLTEARFLPDPDGGEEFTYLTGDMGCMSPDGCLTHLGRKDFQVKIRGYRVEIYETEAALRNHPAIKDAVAVVREDQPGDKRLVAYLVVDGESAPNVTQLRGYLKEKLPDYMLPSAFVVMDSLPITVTGKVDRPALPAPGIARPELENPFVAPRTPVEKTLAEIWSQVLGLDRVGIYDNFFDLGGHSLMATRIVSQVINTLRVKVPLKSLFQSPTVADMAVVITQKQAEKAEREDIDQMLSELEALSDEQAQQLLTDEASIRHF